MKSDKKRQKATTRGDKSMRNENILIAAASGKTQTEIARDFGLERRTVGKVLNSDEAKEIAEREKKRTRLEMYRRKEAAYAALDDSLVSPDEKVRLRAAEIVLKSLGEASEKLELEHSSKPKPRVIEKLNGNQVVHGLPDEEDSDENNS